MKGDVPDYSIAVGAPAKVVKNRKRRMGVRRRRPRRLRRGARGHRAQEVGGYAARRGRGGRTRRRWVSLSHRYFRAGWHCSSRARCSWRSSTRTVIDNRPSRPMAESFGDGQVDLNVAISAYLVTLAVLIPVSGWVAERFGVVGCSSPRSSMFTLASPRVRGQRVAADAGGDADRSQGVGGAMMVPVGPARRAPHDREEGELVKAIALPDLAGVGGTGARTRDRRRTSHTRRGGGSSG